MTTRAWSPALMLFTVAVLVGCSDNGGRYVPADGPAQRLDAAGTAPFLASCQANHGCQSGFCVDFGGAAGKRCSRPCGDASECPSLGGWSCDPQLTACRCQHGGAQPDVCNVDGDCDGQPDRAVTPEVCNDKDDDCNGEVDDVAAGTAGAKLYFEDADGDSYGNVSKARWLCKPQAGWVENDSDCDDSDKAVNPGAIEVCGDKLDNDCDTLIEDPDICGLTPIEVPNIDQGNSAQLTVCDLDGTVAEALDIKEIVAKQDKDVIKFTVRLRGGPSTTVCASYKATFGSATQPGDVVYVYRPAAGACGALPGLSAYHLGQPFSTTAVGGFNAANPGHVSFTIPKVELFDKVPDPTYALRACSNALADALKDITDCSADHCDTPVHR